MTLYIKIENGQPVDHPVFSTNLFEVFGNIPENYELFNRTNKPALGYFELDDHTATQYAKVDGVWTDLWPVRPMTAEEKAEITTRYFDACERHRLHMIEFAESELLKWSASDAQEAITTYIRTMQNFVPQNPITPNFPDYPISPSGEVRKVRGNTSLPGSAPTLIG